MNSKIINITSELLPARLQQLPQPPKQLFLMGETLDILLTKPCVGIVGSRKVTAYGRSVTMQLASELAARGVVIVSGLALGVDSIAHQAAIESGQATIAVLPAGLDRIYPANHHQLAKNIIESGGSLVSEYTLGTSPLKHHFIARNRLIAGLAQVLIVTEAALRSGSLHTARFALEQGKTVMAVPGNITSASSEGTNNLIKAGAVPVTGLSDILLALGMDETKKISQELIADTAEEQSILSLIQTGVMEGSELQLLSGLTTVAFGQTLTMLEITGKVKPLGADRWGLN